MQRDFLPPSNVAGLMSTRRWRTSGKLTPRTSFALNRIESDSFKFSRNLPPQTMNFCLLFISYYQDVFLRCRTYQTFVIFLIPYFLFEATNLNGSIRAMLHDRLSQAAARKINRLAGCTFYQKRSFQESDLIYAFA